jgi:dTDP-glucose pyrophosphorylase
MEYLKEHIIHTNCTIRDALAILDKQGLIANVLFVVDDEGMLQGSLTDGDMRRGFLKGLDINAPVHQAIKKDCHYLTEGALNTKEIDVYKSSGILFLPVVDEKKKIVSILNLKNYKGFIALDAVLMAGGKGKRLHPLTEKIPKPLLKIGDRPIMEHNIDRLKNFGVGNVFVSINYLGEQLVEYFGDGSQKGINITYIKEEKPLGTIGSIKLAENDFKEDTILIMNSDLLTNIDFAEFYDAFISSNADMAVAATSYHVDIPYAVLEVEENNTVQSLKEKPRYTYYSNAGIYLVKKNVLSYIPDNVPFDSTDLMEKLIKAGKKLITYPILGYWLDIGKLEDYKKAQEDIKHININA